MHFLAVGLPFVFLLSALTVQQPLQQQAPPVEKCTIEGQVVKVTGEPLNKARVMLRRAESRDPGYATTTDASGKFLLKDVAPGRYRLFVSRQGYLQQKHAQRGAGRQGSILTLTPGTRMRDLVFKMIPAAVITGRVYGEDGEPLQSANVLLLRYSFFGGRRQLTPSGSGRTNDRGEYRIFGLAPGRYFVSASYPRGLTGVSSGIRFSATEGQHDEGYAPSYYPGTTDPNAAASVEVHAGEEFPGIDFMLTLARAYRIRGRVFNSITGQPARNAQIVLYPREAGTRSFFIQNRALVSKPQGAFELRNVLPGSYTLHAVWLDQNKSYSGRLSIDVGESDVEAVEVTIAPGIELAGSVHVEGGKLTLTDLRVLLESRKEFVFFGGGGASIKKDGRFTIQNVGEGSYNLSVASLPENFYLKSVRAGGDELLDNGLTVAKGTAFPSVEVVISGAGGRVEGLVTNQKDLPISGALVVLVPEPARRAQTALYKTTTTDQFGRFSLKGIRPGEYKLFAWEDVEPGIYQDPEFLRPLESRGKTVRIEESSGQTVELKVITGASPGQ